MTTPRSPVLTVNASDVETDSETILLRPPEDSGGRGTFFRKFDRELGLERDWADGVY